MGCKPSRSNTQIIKSVHVPDPLNLNFFPYWYQVFDFLDFSDLLKISPVCKVFHDHTGNNKILKKFQKHAYSENSVTDCEPVKKEISLEIDHNSEVEPTPSFLSPAEGNKKHFIFSHESRRSSTHNPSDSLDSFLPCTTIKGIFTQNHDPILEINVYESAEFKQGISEPIARIESESEFEMFKTAFWQGIQSCDKIKIQKLLKNPKSAEFLKDPMMDYIKGNERISILAGSVCTMCYILVKLVLEYVQIDDLDRGFVSETIENKTKIIKKITPLQLACARGIYKIVQSLLTKSCSVHISGVFHNKIGLKETITDMGSPALAICVNSKLQKIHKGNTNFITKFEPEDRDYLECAQSLLEFSANPDINTMIPMYPTPLFLSLGKIELVKLLLKYRANPNWTNIRGQTPLYVLVEKKDNLECAKVLVENGALVDPPTCRPIFVAINSKNVESINFLREKGAAVNGNELVPSALQVAVSGDDPNMCKLILSWPDLVIDWEFRQNGKNLFHRIASNSGLAVFNLIVENRNDDDLEKIKKALNQSTLNVPSVGDTIPLYYALHDLRLSKKFIEYGSDINRINVAKCFLENNLERAELQFLIDNKADVKAKWEGKCSVWIAHEKGRIDLLLQIIKGGGDINSENLLGMTVLHDACFKGFDTFVKILLKNGADPKKVCKRGMNAIEYVDTYYPKKTLIVKQKIQKVLLKYYSA